MFAETDPSAVPAVAVLATLLLLVMSGLAVLLRHTWVVRVGQRGVWFRDGKIAGVLEPGRHVRWGRRLDLTSVDVRQTTAAIAGQEVLTADGLPIRLSVTVDTAIVDPILHLTKHASPMTQAYTLIQSAIREIAASVTAEDLVKSRGDLAIGIQQACNSGFAEIGYELKRVQLRDITFPGEIKSIMTAVVRAQKEGLASLERARGESAALRNLANSARLLQENPGLMQLRMLQALAETKGATLVLNAADGSVLPLPAGDQG